MTTLFLERTQSDDNGTFGVLTMQDDNNAVQQLCFTCEPPWRNNLPGESCIMPGTYNCIEHNSMKFPNTWMLMGVPGRSEILIHTGNTIADTHGCILVGAKLGFLGDKPAVLQSREAMGTLRTLLPPTFKITVS